MTVIEVKENGAIRTKMLSCDSPFFLRTDRKGTPSKFLIETHVML